MMLIKLVTESPQRTKRTNSTLRLTASRNHVCVKNGKSAAECEATVLTQGQCTLSRDRLLSALLASRNELNITIEADERHLRAGGMRLPVLSYSSFVPALEDFQVFMSAEAGFISPTLTAGAV